MCAFSPSNFYRILEISRHTAYMEENRRRGAGIRYESSSRGDHDILYQGSRQESFKPTMGSCSSPQHSQASLQQHHQQQEGHSHHYSHRHHHQPQQQPQQSPRQYHRQQHQQQQACGGCKPLVAQESKIDLAPNQLSCSDDDEPKTNHIMKCAYALIFVCTLAFLYYFGQLLLSFSLEDSVYRWIITAVCI